MPALVFFFLPHLFSEALSLVEYTLYCSEFLFMYSWYNITDVIFYSIIIDVYFSFMLFFKTTNEFFIFVKNFSSTYFCENCEKIN